MLNNVSPSAKVRNRPHLRHNRFIFTHLAPRSRMRNNPDASRTSPTSRRNVRICRELRGHSRGAYLVRCLPVDQRLARDGSDAQVPLIVRPTLVVDEPPEDVGCAANFGGQAGPLRRPAVPRPTPRARQGALRQAPLFMARAVSTCAHIAVPFSIYNQLGGCTSTIAPTTSLADAVPSSTTEEANGVDDQSPDSASTQRPGVPSPSAPPGGLGPALASESSASSASLPSAAGLPPELAGVHPAAAASLADLQGAAGLPFFRGPIAMLPRPLLWWPLSEGVESAAGEGGTAAGGLRGLQAVREAVARLTALQTDAAEYSCLKALALFRPEVSGLREASQVERVQEQTLSVLLESSDERPRQQQHRAARLLLLLGSLRAVPATLLEEAYFRPTIGPVPIERILCDVLQTL
ncbi:hypothetical protein HPB50_004201 [Hyalomma asiaticum]|uniref:Uncharacterized protein n=1 Tax=Hyalomma asiaticum TaxID=266040 RepID=A0ACB7ST83_HYAAI|nr:hypothetical protein HPB50_004201 [Hyalomma asiaticum]